MLARCSASRCRGMVLGCSARGSGLGGDRERPADHQLAGAAEFGDRPFCHVGREGLAVPAGAVLDLGEPLALDGPGEDHGGLVPLDVVGRLGKRVVDRRQVVPVDDDDVRAERLRAPRVRVKLPAEVGGPALAKPVDVGDDDKVGQPVVGRLVKGLPHRALGELAVTAKHPHPVREPVQVTAGQCHADAVGQALAERARRHVDPGQCRRGVSLEPLAEPAVAVHKLVVRDGAHGPEHGVEQRGRVALGEDQVVVDRQAGVVPVVAQVARDKGREQVGRGHA